MTELWNDFEEFWALSTRKKSMGDAWKAYQSARRLASKEEIHEGYRRYGIETADKEPQYIKYPAGWLRAWRWRDEADSEVSAPRRSASEQRLANGRGTIVRAVFGD